MSEKCKKISKECFSRRAFSIFARCAPRYNPPQFHNALTSERLLSCRRMPTKRGMKVILTFLPLAVRQIIYRGSAIVSAGESERFLEDLLIADDKSDDITNKYSLRHAVINIFSSRERNNFAGEALFPRLHLSILIVGVNADLIANLACILLRHITQCD